MSRISARSAQSVRVGGNPQALANVVQSTQSASAVSSITINAPTPDALAVMSQDTFNQLQKQNAIGVIAARGRNSVTISFYQKLATLHGYGAGSLLLQSKSLGNNGNPQIDTGNLTPTTVTVSNATIATFTRLKKELAYQW